MIKFNQKKDNIELVDYVTEDITRIEIESFGHEFRDLEKLDENYGKNPIAKGSKVPVIYV